MEVALGAAALWTGAFVAGQISLLRWVVSRNRFKATLAALLLALAGNSLSVFGILADTAGTAQALLAVFYADLALLCAFVLYMPFYYTIAASLSVQTMIALEKGDVSLTELHQRYASMSILEGRLASSAANGYVTRHGDCYRLTTKGQMTARVFQSFKRFWRLGPGG